MQLPARQSDNFS